MRALVLTVLLVLAAGPVRAATADLPALEAAWHGCLREAYAQPMAGHGRQARERTALAACRAQEDAYGTL